MAGEGAEAYKYWAFISYSHADGEWGDWLHKSLETFRVPKRLVGKPSRDGSVPPRLYPVFRDREELPGSSNLGDNINAALAASRYLIVICSPRAAVSRWVNEEVKTFKAMGREDRVLCLIVDGEPNATSKPESGLLECFPQAVRFHVDRDGRVTDEPTEPIAADARSGKDGKPNAKLKLVSGVLGVAYDELKQRDRQRRIRQRFQFAAAALVLVAAVSGIVLSKELQRRRERRRAAAEAEFSNGVKLLERGESAQALAWFARALRQDPSNELLLSRAVSLVTQRGWALPDGPAMPHGGAVTAAEWSPDGERIATASADGFVRVWEATARPLTEPLPQKRAESLSWSPDGAKLASGGAREAAIWDAATGKQIASTTGSNRGPDFVRFSPDGSRLLTASVDGTAAVCNAQTGERLLTLPHGGPVVFARWSPDAQRILTAGFNETVHLWDTATGLPVSEGIKLPTLPFSLEFSPSGGHFAAASDSLAQVWDIAGQPAFTVRHEEGVLGASFSPDNRLLVTASLDKTARIADATNGAPVGPPLKHREAVHAARFNGASDRVVTTTSQGNAQVWNVKSGRPATEPFRERGKPGVVAFDPAGRRILTASDDRSAQVWRISPGAAPLVLSAAGPIASASFEKNGAEVQVVTRTGTAQVFDATSGQLLRTSDKYPAFAALSADRTRRALLDNRLSGITVLDAATSQPLRPAITTPAPVVAVALSANGDRVCAALTDTTVHCWNVASGERLFAPIKHPELVRGISFSFDGTRLATASMDRGARLWDAASGKSIAEPMWHGTPIQGVDFSRDGARLVAATAEGKAVLWSTSAQLPVVEALEHDTPHVQSAQFSPDGTRVLTVSGDRAFVWDAKPVAGPAPAWLPDMLEAVGGMRINDSNLATTLDGRWEKLVATCHRIAASPATDALAHTIKWLLTNAEQRTLSPFSAATALPTPVTPLPVTSRVQYPPLPSPAAQREMLMIAWLQHGSFWSATLSEQYRSGSGEAAEAGLIPIRSFEQALALARETVAAAPESADAYRSLSEVCGAMAGARLFAGQTEQGLGAAQEAVAAAETTNRLRGGDPDGQTLFAQALGNLSALHLFNRQPREAIASASKALEIAPQQTWIKVNVAAAYLLDGDYNEAERICVENKDAELPGFKEKTFARVALKTFDELNAHGIDHPDMRKARELFDAGKR